MSWKWIAMLFGFMLVVILVVQNTTVMTVRLFFWSFEISQALMLFFTFLVGFITGAVFIALKHKKAGNREPVAE